MHFSAVFSWLLPLEFPRLWSLSSCCGSTWSLMVSQQLPLDLTHLTLTSWRNLPETPRKALSLDGSSSDTWLLEVSFLKLMLKPSLLVNREFSQNLFIFKYLFKSCKHILNLYFSICWLCYCWCCRLVVHGVWPRPTTQLLPISKKTKTKKTYYIYVIFYLLNTLWIYNNCSLFQNQSSFIPLFYNFVLSIIFCMPSDPCRLIICNVQQNRECLGM